MELTLRIEGMTYAQITENKMLAINSFNTLKELSLCDFIQYLCYLKEKVFNIVFKNGELEIYLEMLEYVDKLQTKQDEIILDGILKMVKESL